jgi:hypothetical protein
MNSKLGTECGSTQAQIEVDNRIAKLEDFIEKSGRRNARSALVTPKTKRAAAKPPSGGYGYGDDEDEDPYLWLHSAEEALRTPIVPCLPVSSGRASAVSSDGGGASVSSGRASAVPSGRGAAVSSRPSPVLTAVDVQQQIDNSTPTWLGKFESVLLSAIDQKVVAANTGMHSFVASTISPLQDNMKELHSQAVASESRMTAWTEKLSHGMELQGKKTFELGCEMKRIGDRVAAMERAAGIPPPCQSTHVDLTEHATTMPPVHSLKRSAATAELATATDTEKRLARVEDALIQMRQMMATHFATPQSSPASSSSSPQLSLFTSSPNFYGHYCAPGRPVNHEHQQAFVAGHEVNVAVQRYLRDEDRDDFFQRRQQRRNGLLGELGLPCAW